MLTSSNILERDPELWEACDSRFADARETHLSSSSLNFL